MVFRGRVVTVVVGILMAVSLLAVRATGKSDWDTLVHVETIFDTDPGITGLSTAYAVAVSPEGKHVYVGSYSGFLTVFSRNPATGALTFIEAQQDGSGSVDGLSGAQSVAVSPESGSYVYVAGFVDNAVAVFSRNYSSGALTFVQAQIDGTGSVDGLSGCGSVAVSPDGKNVFATGYYDDAVAVFSCNLSTGALTFVEAHTGGLQGASVVAVSPDGKHVYVTEFKSDSVSIFTRDAVTGALTSVDGGPDDGEGGVDGLDGAQGVTVSPDGNHVYVTGSSDDAVAVFRRDPSTGDLSFIEVHKDGVAGVDGLNSAASVTVSFDGHHVYVTGYDDHALAVFRRNPTTGRLTFLEVHKDGVGGLDGLDSANSAAVSPDGDHVYVTGPDDHAVVVFESMGPAPRESPPSFLAKWGAAGDGAGEFQNLTGLGTGSLYVADIGNDRIQKFDAAGNFVREWGSSGSANGQFDLPVDVAVDSLGDVYVVDAGNDRIQVFDADGNYLRQWGSTGSALKQFNSPSSVALNSGDTVFVADTWNRRIQMFTSDGLQAMEWGSQGREPGQFVRPAGVAVGLEGDIYVSDAQDLLAINPPQHRIHRFDKQRNFRAAWGAGPSEHNGRFNMPVRLAADTAGNVYVPDSQNHRIQKFDRDGNFLVAWGTLGSGDGQFNTPRGVAVDAFGRIYVADTYNDRIQVFGGPYLDVFVGENAAPRPTLWLAPPSAYPQK